MTFTQETFLSGAVNLDEVAPVQLGTEALPFLITNVGELAAIGDNNSSYYELANDIDMTSWGEFTALSGFSGTFDGKGYELQNADLDHSGTPAHAGIFDLPTGTIKNVGVRNATAQGGDGTFYTGTLISRMGNTCAITECYAVGGTVTTDGNNAGGLVGQTNVTNSSITRCYAAVEISGAVGANVGGLLGITEAGHTTVQSYFDEDTATTSSLGAGGGAGQTALSYLASHLEASYVGFDFSADWIVSRLFAQALVPNAPALTFTAAGDTIARASGSWIADGFAATDVIELFAASGLNIDLGREVSGVTASTLTMVDDFVTDEGSTLEYFIFKKDYPTLRAK